MRVGQLLEQALGLDRARPDDTEGGDRVELPGVEHDHPSGVPTTSVVPSACTTERVSAVAAPGDSSIPIRTR